MKISRSAYYAWLKRPAKLITAEQLSLYRRAKAVFEQSRNSLGYTSKRYRRLLTSYGIRASMGDVGACWDNAVVERFFGSLKHDWVLKIPQPTRKQIKEDVIAYMRYYNLERLHTANGDLPPIEYEQNSLRKVS